MNEFDIFLIGVDGWNPPKGLLEVGLAVEFESSDGDWAILIKMFVKLCVNGLILYRFLDLGKPTQGREAGVGICIGVVVDDRLLCWILVFGLGEVFLVFGELLQEDPLDIFLRVNQHPN